MVQWLGLCASAAGGMGSIPGWGTKIPHAARHSQEKKQEFLDGDSRTLNQVWDFLKKKKQQKSWLSRIHICFVPLKLSFLYRS